jgi:hypothetical protein
MAKTRSARKSRKQGRASLNKTKLAILIAAIVAITIAVFLTGSKSSNSAYASPVNQKRYKATRAIVVDRETGQQRLPNQQEIDEVVSQLSVLAARPEDLPQTLTADGAVTVDLAGGYGGVMLARPGDANGWETKCVFTFEEGAEFLGLVEDNSAE